MIVFGPYRAGRAEWNHLDFTEKLALRRLHRSKDQSKCMATLYFYLEAYNYVGIACTCLYLLPAICGLCPAFPALNMVVPAAI
jgi:hypothetical protein